MKAFITIILSVFVVSCAQKNDATKTTTTTGTGYQLSNGVCYSTSTGQQVASGFCTSTNSGYYLNNGSCIMSSTGQQVDYSFCASNTMTGNQCIGVYIWTVDGRSYTCSINQATGISDCRGFTMIQPSTGTQVTCQ